MNTVLFVSSNLQLGRILAHQSCRLWNLSQVSASSAVFASLHHRRADVILFDPFTRGCDALALLEDLHSTFPVIPLFIVSSLYSHVIERRCMLYGALQWFTFPFEFAVLEKRVAGFLSHGPGSDVTHLGVPIDALPSFMTKSPDMMRVVARIKLAARSAFPVLLTGESGTGKEVAARLVHRLSVQSAHSFVPCNVGCLCGSLADSQLFGSRRGGFTDARDLPGVLVEAEGGTLFLDEIGELETAVQVKLLRALEEGVVRPIGASTSVAVNFRLVCATNRNLSEAVTRQRFRSDLLSRIDVLRIHLPPLRDRPEDLPLLAEQCLTDLGKELSACALQRLLLHSWPGNVRELFNCLRRSACYSPHTVLKAKDILI